MTTKPMLQQFEQEGYLLGIPLLEPHDIARVDAAYGEIVQKRAAEGVTGRVTNAHHTDAVMWQTATNPRVLDLIESLVGPDIILMSSGFFVKPPASDDRFVAWHQDTMYWGLEPPFAVTVWLAIDDADVENGCMRVIPRSHLLGLLPHRTAERDGNLLGENQEIDSALFDETSAVDFCLKAGSASVHHGELIHGSNPNRSSRRRCGMTLRFTTPNVKPIIEGDHPFRDKPILVRGEDRFGNFIYAPPPF